MTCLKSIPTSEFNWPEHMRSCGNPIFAEHVPHMFFSDKKKRFFLIENLLRYRVEGARILEDLVPISSNLGSLTLLESYRIFYAASERSRRSGGQVPSLSNNFWHLLASGCHSRPILELEINLVSRWIRADYPRLCTVVDL